MNTSDERTIQRRARYVRDRPIRPGPLIYWMTRDQRVEDNWALIYSLKIADEHNVPMGIAFCLVPEYLNASLRQYAFMIKGLQELESRVKSMGIGFHLLEGFPEVEFPRFLHEVGAGMMVTDFDPLRPKRDWKRRVSGEIPIPVVEVDAHNIVPCWLVAGRRISSYATFREKIAPHLDEFLCDFPAVKGPEIEWPGEPSNADWAGALSRLRIDRSVGEVDWIVPGETAAKGSMRAFLRERLHEYVEKAENPVASGQSDLSPYFHFGQLSSQRVALEVRGSDADEATKQRYLDQIIVKKELSDNFCLHTPEYDTFGAFPKWARDSIDSHRSDPREHVYNLRQLEDARTHDPLWNAAQTELRKVGKIHGSLRAYWANRILEWTRSPEEALSFALHLNDKWGLDARDPNGYTGIAMVIGGLYDRPFVSKEVIGKVRRLTYTGERLRYDIKAFEEKVSKL